MVRQHLISYILFVLAALFLLFALLATSSLRGAPGIILALVFVLAGVIFYRRRK